MKTPSEIWLYLSHSAIFWLFFTLLAYQLGIWVYQKCHYNTFLSPFIVAVALILGVLCLSETSYENYFEGAQMIHLLLGPATVALAVPLFDYRRHIIKLFIPIVVGVSVGSITGIVSTLVLGGLLNISMQSSLSLAPKSVTTPIAMSIAQQIGGLPEFTAAVVAITGVVGALMAVPLLRLFKIKSDVAKGFAIGMAAHGMGTSRAFQISNKAGAFSGLAMGLSGIWTAFLAPYIAPWILSWFY